MNSEPVTPGQDKKRETGQTCQIAVNQHHEKSTMNDKEEKELADYLEMGMAISQAR